MVFEDGQLVLEKAQNCVIRLDRRVDGVRFEYDDLGLLGTKRFFQQSVPVRQSLTRRSAHVRGEAMLFPHLQRGERAVRLAVADEYRIEGAARLAEDPVGGF